MSLRPEVNELLTQTDKGSPMGELFRQYWIPALLASELPENDCSPVRCELLGEKMIAFRDSEGRYGLIEEFRCGLHVTKIAGYGAPITVGSSMWKAIALISHRSPRKVTSENRSSWMPIR